MNLLHFFIRLIRARIAGLIRIRRVKGPIRLECNDCGLCCRSLEGTFVEENEAPPLRQSGGIDGTPGALRLLCHGTSCVLLASGRCSQYIHRPRGCREYPWYNIAGNLYYDKGCPGIRHDYDEHPEPESLRPIDHYFPLPASIRRLVYFLIHRW